MNRKRTRALPPPLFFFLWFFFIFFFFGSFRSGNGDIDGGYIALVGVIDLLVLGSRFYSGP